MLYRVDQFYTGDFAQILTGVYRGWLRMAGPTCMKSGLTGISDPAGKIVMLAAECITGPDHSIHLHIGIPELKEKEIRDLIDLVGSNDPDIIAILEKSIAKYIIDEFGSSGIVYDLSPVRPLLPHERREQGDQLCSCRHPETWNTCASQTHVRQYSFRVNHIRILKRAGGLRDRYDPYCHGSRLLQC